MTIQSKTSNKYWMIIILFIYFCSCPIYSQPMDTIYINLGAVIGKIYPTYHRINIWDVSHTGQFPAYPHHKYTFLREANLMTATGGRESSEMFDINGNHRFSILANSIQNLLDSGLKPIIVIGNTPEALSDMPGEKGLFNANVGKPKNYKKYYDYILKLFEFLAKRFPDSISNFEFRFLTEPDFYTWFNNGLEEYKKLYDLTLGAMQEALRKFNISPIVLHPGNLIAPLKDSDTLSMFYPWTIALAKWLKEDYSGKFIETFDKGLSNWEVQGNIRINENNELVISKGKIFSIIANQWENFELSFTMKSTSYDNRNNASGIIIKYKNDNDYFIVNFYNKSKGILVFSRMKNGIIRGLDSIETNINFAESNSFFISSCLDTFKIFINDKLYLRFFSENSGSGKIGFTNESKNSDLVIDNIIGNQFYYVTNFNNLVNWDLKASVYSRNNEMILGNGTAIYNESIVPKYKMNFTMKTDTSGDDGSDVAWLLFDYLDSNNYSAFVLNYHGYIEYKKITNGQTIVSKSSWTGLPKPYFFADFDEIPKDRHGLISNGKKIENGVLKINNDHYIIGYFNPLFCYEYRIRAKIQSLTSGANGENKNLILFKYKDKSNYWSVQLKNDKEGTLLLKRKFKGKDSIFFKAKTGIKAEEFNRFDIRVGGNIVKINDGESWETIENNINILINDKEYIRAIIPDDIEFGRIGFWSPDSLNSIYIDDYLLTYEGDSRAISPLDYHNFEFISDDFVKILSINGITYAVVYDNDFPSSGKIGFKANNSMGIHINNIKISELLPYNFNSFPRIPEGSNPRFSFSYYIDLKNENEQKGYNPEDLKRIIENFRTDISPYFMNPLIEIAEGGLYIDDDGNILSCGDGTELGSAWNAAIYKNSLDVGLEAFAQWGYTTEELKSPTFNLFELIEEMNNSDRISVRFSSTKKDNFLNAIASKKQDTIFILIYNFTSYRFDKKSNARFILNINNMPINEKFILEDKMIDSIRANFFHNWLNFCVASGITTLPGKSKYDMNITGAYESQIIEQHWKKQKEFYKSRGDDIINSYSITILSGESGQINLPINIPKNGLNLLKIYPKGFD